MTTSKKKRLSMLDNLAAAGGPSPAPSGSAMSTNRALRSARDAVDSHHVWDLDPDHITDTRVGDRLDQADVYDLLDAIEANGQTVPILVRRDPANADRYLLVYGRRRLEAIRLSTKVNKVRALVANLDDHAAVTAQISENMARRDLSFIEKALFAQELLANGFGNQSQIAEALTVTKSAISMALAIAETISAPLIRAIGPAHGIGRPRWEALGKSIEAANADRDRLIGIADDIYTQASVAIARDEVDQNAPDISVQAFEAVEDALAKYQKPKQKPKKSGETPAKTRSRPLAVSGSQGGTVKRTAKGISISVDEGAFADWLELEAQNIINDLHARWLQRAED
ncbi:MAG: plasmid partitioning protein RepB [Paracoccaceae bacterium]|jgi:ParB family chromosome partitioning protein|nr:plasmid partitioning protein RepB [Paracoccaceae bacterium]MDP7184740.1 plasmid partitioning protein RepB [Paracoccaceae bacterium]